MVCGSAFTAQTDCAESLGYAVGRNPRSRRRLVQAMTYAVARNLLNQDFKVGAPNQALMRRHHVYHPPMKTGDTSLV